VTPFQSPFVKPRGAPLISPYISREICLKKFANRPGPIWVQCPLCDVSRGAYSPFPQYVLSHPIDKSPRAIRQRIGTLNPCRLSTCSHFKCCATALNHACVAFFLSTTRDTCAWSSFYLYRSRVANFYPKRINLKFCSCCLSWLNIVIVILIHLQENLMRVKKYTQFICVWKRRWSWRN
jgi:hypothetical protein